MSAVVGRLTIVNVLTAATGFITGPLLARALGPEGRGDLAAILVTMGLAVPILSLALPYFANRETARGRPLNVVLGSAGVPLLAMGALGAVCALPLAAALAEGRESVRVCLVIVFLGLPVWLSGNLLLACLQGLERWSRLIAARVIAFGFPFLSIVALFLTDHLTVVTAAAPTLIAGVLSILPALSLIRERGWPVFRAPVARQGIVFGVKTWVGGLALIANARLDQLVMITAVSPRELGLYAVATTIAGAPALLTGAITAPLLTRTAQGHALLPQTLRVTLVLTAILDLVLAAATPLLLGIVFGPAFAGATVMTFVLLAASLPQAGASVISAALQGDGRPVIPSVAEGLALIITVAGLALLLGPLGASGAAITSLLAYSASFVYQLAAAWRRWDAPLQDYLLPTRTDAHWARDLAGGLRNNVVKSTDRAGRKVRA